MWQSAFSGFQLSLGLIMAIGAQNAFVLRQGLMRQHVLAVCLFCATSDAILITAGVVGLGVVTERAPGAVEALRWLGVAFLAWYGWRAFRSAWRGGASLEAAGQAERRLPAVLAILAAITWANPHVWLDTVILIGSVAAQHGEARTAFAVGAVTASFVFFLALGYGARVLAPLFRRPRAWQILDALVGTIMWTIAARLALG
ncbi:LysE/ArgO family amino acid transporter [Albidovulum sp.]